MKTELDWGPISVDGGKYTFQSAEDGWSVDVLRYGEPWLNIKSGHKAILALAFEVEALREQVAPRQAPLLEVLPAGAFRKGPVNTSVPMRSRADLSRFTVPASEVEPKRDPLAACTGCYYLVTDPPGNTPHCDDLHGTVAGEPFFITDPTQPPPAVCPLRKKKAPGSVGL